MGRAHALCTVVLSAIACTTLVYEARYDIGLSAVARRERAGEVKNFIGVHGHTFEDEFVRITWTPLETQLGFILVNKTDSPQSVLWDEIRYLGTDGKFDRVLHEGVKVANPSVAMPPTVVAPRDTLLELIEPRAHVSAGMEWYNAPLIGFTQGTSEAAVRSKMVHGTIKVLVPIAANGAIREYLFQFSIKGNVVLSGWAS